MSHLYSVVLHGPPIFYLTALTGGWLPAFTAAAELLSINYLFNANNNNWIALIPPYSLFLYAITFFGIGLFSILFHYFAIPGIQHPYHPHVDRKTLLFYTGFFAAEFFGLPFAIEAVLPSTALSNPWASFLVGIGTDAGLFILLTVALFYHTKLWEKIRGKHIERQLIYVGSVFHELKQVVPTMLCIWVVGLFMRASSFFGMIQGPGQTQNADLYVGLAEGCMIIILGPIIFFVLRAYGLHGKKVMTKLKENLHRVFPPLFDENQNIDTRPLLGEHKPPPPLGGDYKGKVRRDEY